MFSICHNPSRFVLGFFGLGSYVQQSQSPTNPANKEIAPSISTILALSLASANCAVWTRFKFFGTLVLDAASGTRLRGLVARNAARILSFIESLH